MGWQEGDLDIDGARFHYYRRGRGSPLVLAHGAGDSGDCWTRVAAALEDSYDVIAYDARYHGLSDATPGPGGGADLIAVVEKLGLERPALMGHSMGAGSVIRACAARPEMFRRAVLEDPGLRLAVPGGVTPAPARNPTDYSTMTAAEIEAEGRSRSPMWDEVEWERVGALEEALSPAGGRRRLVLAAGRLARKHRGDGAANVAGLRRQPRAWRHRQRRGRCDRARPQPQTDRRQAGKRRPQRPPRSLRGLRQGGDGVPGSGSG